MSTSASAARASEPSMEEILSSIRKIIADDQKALETKAAPAQASAAVPAPASAGAEDEDDDILDLELATESPAPPAQPAPAAVAAPTRAPAQPQPAFQPPPYHASPAPDQRLISDQAAAATSNAFHALANTVFSQNARTLDDLVGEMLRPMLKSWLDQNLPGLVERLVRAEIERVARGGR